MGNTPAPPQIMSDSLKGVLQTANVNNTPSASYTIPNELPMAISSTMDCNTSLANAVKNVTAYKAYITDAQAQYNTQYANL